MASITVNLRGLSGSLELEVPSGSTVADVRAAAAENGSDIDGLTVRADGQTVGDDTPVRDEQILVTTPAEAKHGHR